MKIKLRPEVNKKEWHRKFIIFPRRIDDYLVFLQTVNRRLLWWDPTGWASHTWEYTLVENPPEPKSSNPNFGW
jgi:hypothetical protein